MITGERTILTDKTAYHLEDQIGFKLRLANQRHLEIFSSEMPDLTPRQFAVLAKLRDEGTTSQNQLGRMVAMDAATTKGVVERLAKKGMIATSPSPTDRRRIDISLTDEGHALLARVVPIAARISERTMRNLTLRERARLLTLLDKL